MQYLIAILGFGLAVFVGWLYHKRTQDMLNRYERLVDDMFDRKMARGDYQQYAYGKSIKPQQRVIKFLEDLQKDKEIPAQMPSNRG